jgi:hypothetical protein
LDQLPEDGNHPLYPLEGYCQVAATQPELLAFGQNETAWIGNTVSRMMIAGQLALAFCFQV